MIVLFKNRSSKFEFVVFLPNPNPEGYLSESMTFSFNNIGIPKPNKLIV